jgi:Nucleotidyl transferase of unknown function (DUF2204)
LSDASFDRLLQLLSEGGVDFVLIGGLALSAWGVVRATKDVDVVVASEPRNLERLAKVAVAARGHVQAGESFLSSEPSIAARVGEGKHVVIETELGRLDIVQGLEGVPAYTELRERAVGTTVLDVPILVCSLEDLRAMKHASGRTRDIADLEDLDAISDL